MVGAFIAGLFIGAWLGFIIFALCNASKGDNDNVSH